MTKPKDPKDLKKRGRKTTYRASHIDKVDEYLKQCIEVEDGKERKLPSRIGYAIYLGVGSTTIEQWEKRHPDFKGALSKIKDYQHEECLNRGFNGTGNPTITQLVLKNNHGYRDKHEHEHSGGINVVIKN